MTGIYTEGIAILNKFYELIWNYFPVLWIVKMLYKCGILYGNLLCKEDRMIWIVENVFLNLVVYCENVTYILDYIFQ